MIFLIFLGADMLNSALALSQMPAQLARLSSRFGLPPLVVIVGILLFYIVLGCVMDELSMILLTIPMLLPGDHGPRPLRAQRRPRRRSGSASWC